MPKRKSVAIRCAANVGSSSIGGSVKRTPILQLMSACIEETARLKRFERLAGRSAMVGVITAIGIELVTQNGIFGALSAAEVEAVTALGVAGICVAVLMASNKKSKGLKSISIVYEAVISSMTAVRGSNAGVTQLPVDSQVDALLEVVFAKVPSLVDYDDEGI